MSIFVKSISNSDFWASRVVGSLDYRTPGKVLVCGGRLIDVEYFCLLSEAAVGV